jgi:hypothetical protein
MGVLAFNRACASVVQSDVGASVKRSSGISYRELDLTFADSQRVTVRIKQSGDIFQVLLNGTLLAIRNQDDHVQAIGEIAKAMDAGRAKFQKKLAAAKVKTPPGIRTAAPKLEQVLIEKRDSLKSAIAETREQIAKLRGAHAVG